MSVFHINIYTIQPIHITTGKVISTQIILYYKTHKFTEFFVWFNSLSTLLNSIYYLWFKFCFFFFFFKMLSRIYAGFIAIVNDSNLWPIFGKFNLQIQTYNTHITYKTFSAYPNTFTYCALALENDLLPSCKIIMLLK